MIVSRLVTFQNEFRTWPILKALFQSIPFIFIGNDIVFSQTVLKAIPIFCKK